MPLTSPRRYLSTAFALTTLMRCKAGLVESKARQLNGAGGNLRLVDAAGMVSNAGLLQIRNGNGEFGSVCGMNLEAADVVCRQLGYDFGSVGTSPCSSYGGLDLCSAAGTPVSMKELSCGGGELDVQDCQWEAADAGCSGHTLDSIVYCGKGAVADHLAEGALRLLSYDGSPSINGEGRLETFRAGQWAPVCNSGFNAGAAVVACKSMGHTGAKPSSVQPDCRDVKGNNFCGTLPPHVSELACTGQEPDLQACSFEEGDDVFCAPEESVIISCEG